MADELKNMIEQKFAEWQDFQKKAQTDLDNVGTVATETKAAIETIKTDLDALAEKLERQDASEIAEGKSFADDLAENEDFQRMARDEKGSATLHFKSFSELERKATITSSAVGSATSGVLQIDRMAGVVPLARKRLFIRDLLPVVPTTMNAIDFVKISSAPMSPAMQTEGSDKSESSLHFSTETANVRTLAHWIPATTQILSDFPGLQGIINDHLIYHYKDIEETQVLSGAGTGQNLNGLVTQATSFTTSLLGSNYTKIDQVRRVIQQVASSNETECQWLALNPIDWADIELTKVPVQANYGGPYVVGNPNEGLMPPSLWRRAILETNNLASGTFLAGNSMGAAIRDREGVSIQISTEHSDYFTNNMVAIRCEGRLTLVVTRPASYITGSFVTSP